VDAVRAALGTRLEPLHGRTFVNEGFADEQLVLVERNTVTVCGDPGICHGRRHYLEYRLRSTLLGKLQNRQSLIRLLATNKVDDAPGLHRRYADMARNCLGFHCFPSLVYRRSAKHSLTLAG